MLPLPRRLLILGFSVFSVVLFLHTFIPTLLPPLLTPHLDHHEPEASYFSGAKWLPPVFNPDYVGSRPSEYDEHGSCLFLSPFEALSAAEKRKAEQVVLERVSAGIVRGKAASTASAPSTDLMNDEFELVNVTKTTPKAGDIVHPIIGLLRDGEMKWKELVARQSQTLAQAVEVYKDRWGRNPPKGFDLWWSFARANNVYLPDEYDAVLEALLPYYGLSITTMQERMQDAEKVLETFTLIVQNGKVELQWNDNYSRDWWWSSRPRAEAQINLMEPFLQHLPNFRATFTIHDQPSILLDHTRKAELLAAAKSRSNVKTSNEDDRNEFVWHKACPPESPMNRGGSENPEPDSFVAQHLETMDICEHPSFLENHGMFLEEHTDKTQPKPHTKLLPIFAQSKTALNGDIPVTPVFREGQRDDIGHDTPWKKKSGKLYWRGLATGMNHNKESGAKWRQNHRERLHFLTNNKSEALVDVLAPIGSSGNAQLTSVPIRKLGEYYTDTKIAGSAWQCSWDDGTCDEMKAEISFAPEDPAEKSNEYKYIFDTDGNAWSSRFPRLMESTGLVIKSTVFPEWNSHNLPEWYAYVPSKMDYSDLFSILSFFRGTPSGRGAHDEVARRIALNGQCWVEKTWRREDLQVYMYRLYLEYARLVSPERDSGKMDFVLPSA